MKLIDYLEAHNPLSLILGETLSRETAPNVANGRRCPNLGEWRNFWGGIREMLGPARARQFSALRETKDEFLWNNRLHRNVSTGRDVLLALNNIVGRPVEEILGRVYGIDSAFGDARVTVKVGDPDRVLFALRELTQGSPQEDASAIFNEALFVVEARISWLLDLRSLHVRYNEELRAARAGTEPSVADQSELLKAVAQVHAYMVMNDLPYGILTTYDSTYFFRLIRGGRNTRFEVSPEIRQDHTGDFNLVAAFVGIAVRRWRELQSLGLGRNPKYLVSGLPRPLFIPCKEDIAGCLGQRKFQSGVAQPLDPGFQLFVDAESAPSGGIKRTEDIKVAIRFERFVSRNLASTSYGSLEFGRETKTVILKVYDLSTPGIARVCEREIEIHSILAPLQGVSVPKVWAIGTLWGLLKVIAMEPCGKQVPQPPPAEYYEQAPVLLRAVHSHGIVHGDIALRNFTVSEGKRFWLIDFNSSRQGTAKDFRREETNFLEQLRRMKEGYIARRQAENMSSTSRTSRRATKL
ncbi:hypothetical protein TWF694_001131 [Orbilia ellipsospora]|uniref:Non-specific serine/threonine protein kinase n=1 Tax=Orbilia ellipsospora TaxID=2528407 RepID=A0AAV9XS67_9PEZI